MCKFSPGTKLFHSSKPCRSHGSGMGSVQITPWLLHNDRSKKVPVPRDPEMKQESKEDGWKIVLENKWFHSLCTRLHSLKVGLVLTRVKKYQFEQDFSCQTYCICFFCAFFTALHWNKCLRLDVKKVFSAESILSSFTAATVSSLNAWVCFSVCVLLISVLCSVHNVLFVVLLVISIKCYSCTWSLHHCVLAANGFMPQVCF